ncbi:MAG: Hsp20/alpha crystallin family protein [Pseudomonadota bacterium]
MNVVRWSPFREFDNLFQSLERTAPSVRRADWLPLVDIRETETEYQIDVEVPAVAAEDLSVSLHEGVLTVAGERKVSEASDAGRLHRLERRSGRFVRNFQLPENVDAEAIQAEARDGVLYLRLAKQAVPEARNIEIKVASS